MALEFRSTNPADDDAVYAVNLQAFGQAGEADLALALIHEGDAPISMVAIEDGRIVAHVILSPLGGLDRALALAPLAVLPERQARGIGSALVGHALEEACRLGWRCVFVLGEPAYYTRFGFSADLAKGAETPWSEPYLQGLELVPGALSGFAGPLTYAPAFSKL